MSAHNTSANSDSSDTPPPQTSSIPIESCENYTTIDWLRDVDPFASTLQLPAAPTTHREALQVVLQYLFEGSEMWLAAFIMGVLIAILAAFVEVVTHLLTDLKRGICVDYLWAPQLLCCLYLETATCTSYQSWTEVFHDSSGLISFVMYVILSVIFAVLSAWLCRQYSPAAAGSGIIEIKTILSGVRISNYLSGTVLLIKSVGLCLSVGSGLTLGKEGPFVHVGCCVAALVARIFPSYKRREANQRELISVGAGIGVAVAFGSPLGGVLFALEEVSYYFPHKIMVQTFFANIVATLVLRRLDPTHTGRIVQFAVAYRHPWHWFELGAFALVGVVGGLGGAVINRMNRRWLQIKRQSLIAVNPLYEVSITALITAVVCYQLPFTRFGMLQGLSAMFTDCGSNDNEGALESVLCGTSEATALVEVVFSGLIRLLLMTVTFGIRVPAGCFVPALFIGSCLGRAVGIWMKAIVAYRIDDAVFAECGGDVSACVIPGIYAIIGAAALLAGVTRMTLCVVVIMFELTGGLEYVVPCMLAVILACWVGEMLGVPSIYEVHLANTTYPYIDPKEEFRHGSLVGDVVDLRRPLVVFEDGGTLADIVEILHQRTYRWFPVVGSGNGVLLGCVSRAAVIQKVAVAESVHTPLLTKVSFRSEASEGVDWSSLLETQVVIVSPSLSVYRLLHSVKALGMQYALVVEGGRPVTVVTRKDLLKFVRRIGHGMQRLGLRDTLVQWARRSIGRHPIDVNDD